MTFGTSFDLFNWEFIEGFLEHVFRNISRGHLSIILTCLPLAGGHRNRPVIVVITPSLFTNEILQVGTIGRYPVHIRCFDSHASIPGTAFTPAEIKFMIKDEYI